MSKKDLSSHRKFIDRKVYTGENFDEIEAMIGKVGVYIKNHLNYLTIGNYRVDKMRAIILYENERGYCIDVAIPIL